MVAIRAPKNCGLYLPGHVTHWIHAKKGWEDKEHAPVPCDFIDGLEDGTVLIEVAGEQLRLWHHQPDRLVEAVENCGRNVKYQDQWRLLKVHDSPGGSYVFNMAKLSHNPIPCPATPPSGSPAELLNSAGGFTIPVRDPAKWTARNGQ